MFSLGVRGNFDVSYLTLLALKADIVLIHTSLYALESVQEVRKDGGLPLSTLLL